MNWDQFSLRKRPFAIAPDPSMMIWTRQHKEVYETLQKEALARSPLTVLTGDIGCGKTTLLQAFLQDPVVDAQYQVVLNSIRLGSSREFLQHLLISLLGDAPKGSEEEYLAQLRDVVEKAQTHGKMPFIIVDEAQTMALDVGILIARLAGGELTNGPPPATLLAGQPELSGVLSQRQLKPLSSAIGKRLRLGPLSREEVANFISGRLAAAGFEGGTLFDADAIQLIYKYSRGIPRLVNKLCDLCLFKAAHQKRQTITAPLVQDALAQFLPPGGTFDTAQTTGSSPLDDMTDTFVFSMPATSDAKNKVTLAGALSLAAPAKEDTSNPVQVSPVRRKTGKAGNSQPKPRPAVPQPEAVPAKKRNSAFGYMRGALVAALFGVPLLLVLPQPESPLKPTAPESSAFVDIDDDVPEQISQPSTPNAKLQADHEKTSNIGSDHAAVSFRDEMEIAESKLSALNQSMSKAQAEKEALEAMLLLTQKQAERAAFELASAQQELATMRLAAIAEATPAPAQPTGVQIPPQQTDALAQRLLTDSKGARDEIRVATSLDAATDPAGKPPLSTPAIEAINLPVAQGDILAFEPVAIEPIFPSDADGADSYFADALASTKSADIALNYARAAIRGHERAAMYLGQLFETGDGVAYDAEIARRWYHVAEDMGQLHQPQLVSDELKSGSGSIVPMGAFATDDKADFIWQGGAALFTMELADADARPIAFVETPLTAVRVELPQDARFWRIVADGKTSFDWQPLSSAAD